MVRDLSGKACRLRRSMQHLLGVYSLPAQTVDATLAWSLLAGVWKPKVFLGR